MRQRLAAELVALFGRATVDKAKAEPPQINGVAAQTVYQASSELINLEGQPTKQRQAVASYPEWLQLALINWILRA